MKAKRMPGVRLKCGLARFKVRRRIQECLDGHGISQADLARELGVCHQLVSGTINGNKHSPLVLDRLRELGVPERYLFDPNQTEAADTEGKVA